MSHHAFICADVIDGLKLIRDNTVQSIITSPPYWGLRDYGAAEQIGLEATPEEYADKLVVIFREAKRVLRDDGTLWLNLGDSYAGARRKKHNNRGSGYEQKGERETLGGIELKPKDLIGIPWLVAFALRADGWYLRSDVVWEKTNAMPESVKDRPTKTHEYVFLLSKNQKYFYDNEAIKELSNTSLASPDPNGSTLTGGRYGRHYLGAAIPERERRTSKQGRSNQAKAFQGLMDKQGRRNRRSVWSIPTRPFLGAHFATFPPDLIRPMILASTSEYGACSHCGAPAKRIIELGEPDLEWQKACGGDKEGQYKGQAKKNYAAEGAENASEVKARILAGMRKRVTVGWDVTCNCNSSPEEIVPCIVLDPFGGAGTVALVAKELKRDSIYIDIKKEYLHMAVERCDFGSSIGDSHCILPYTPESQWIKEMYRGAEKSVEDGFS